MVVQKAIKNLKEGPKEDKVAVAGGIAISVVAVLLIVWGVWFIRKIQKSTQEVNLSSGAQDEFNFTSVKEAQQQLQQTYTRSTEELLKIRNDVAAGQAQYGQNVVDPQSQRGLGSQFDPPPAGQ